SEKSYLYVSRAYLPDIVDGLTGRRSVILRYPWLLPLGCFLVGGAFFLLARVMGKARLMVSGWVLATVTGFIAALLVLRHDEELRIGPIPKGTPISLLANIDTAADPKELIEAVIKTEQAIKAAEREPDETRALDRFLREAGPVLIRLNRCPDFVEDRGHYFGTGLSDEDKEALIEYL